MGLVLKGFRATYTLIDSGGNTSEKTIDFTSADQTAFDTDEPIARAALIGVTDAVIAGSFIGPVYYENALALPATAEVETKLSMTLRLANKGNAKSNMAIPAPKIGLFQGSTGPAKNTVNYTSGNTALVTYLDLFRETTGIATFSDGDFLAGAAAGNPINGLVKGVRATVRSRQA